MKNSVLWKTIIIAMAFTASFSTMANAFYLKEGIHEKKFGMVYSFSEGLAAFANENGKCGFMNEDGEVVIAPEWDMVSDFDGGAAMTFSGDIAIDGNPGDGSYRLINTEGEYISEEWRWMSQRNEGFAAVKDSNGRFGVINTEGEIILNPEWDWACTLSDNYFLVQKDGLYAYVSREGEIVSDFRREYEARYSEGRANIRGENGLYGYIDENQNMVTDCIFAAGYPFHGGFALVQSAKNGLYGYIDKNGNLICEMQWADGGDFSEGYAWVRAYSERNDGIWYLMDEEGNIDMDRAPFYYMGKVTEKMIAAQSYPEGMGFYDVENQKFIPLEMLGSSGFIGGTCVVEIESGIGVIDREGTFLIPAEWEKINPFSKESTITTARKDGNWYIIDRNGNEITGIDLSDAAFIGDTVMDDTWLKRRETVLGPIMGSWRLSFLGDRNTGRYGDTDDEITITFKDDDRLIYSQSGYEYQGFWHVVDVIFEGGEKGIQYYMELDGERMNFEFIDAQDENLNLLKVQYPGCTAYFLQSESDVPKGYDAFMEAFYE